MVTNLSPIDEFEVVNPPTPPNREEVGLIPTLDLGVPALALSAKTNVSERARSSQ